MDSMPAVVLSPSPVQQFLDNNGRPLIGGKLFTYIAGTNTKLATYTDAGGVSQNTNPILLDYRGECDLWIPPNVAYKLVLSPSGDTDPPTNPIWTVDELVSSQLITLYGGVDSGVANAYVLTFDANFTAYTDGIVIYWIPSNDNTTASTLNVNGLGPISIINQNGAAVSAGQIVANYVTIVMYKGGSWLLLQSGVAAPYLTGTFTGTLTGMTGSVTKTIRYRVSGNIVSLSMDDRASDMTGTSNTTGLSLTGLPAAIDPGTLISWGFCGNVIDNGVRQSAIAQVVSGVGISFGLDFDGSTAFTNSGTKGLYRDWNLMYQLG
jgi:hypothetical protein